MLGLLAGLTSPPSGGASQDPVLGCKRAALRKLGQELGVPADALTPEDLLYTTRMSVSRSHAGICQ